MSMWDEWRSNYYGVKPDWLYKFELYEKEVSKRTGVSVDELRDIVEKFKEYKILEE